MSLARASELGAADPNGVMQLAIWTETSLTLPDDLTFAAWEEFGSVLLRLGRGLQWWIGDWWNFGERRYGDRIYQAQVLGIEPKTISNFAWVASQYEPSSRKEHVSFGHHNVAAKVPAPERERLLDEVRASQDDEGRGGITISELTSRIRRAGVAFEDTVALPAGKYNVLLADPPWRYDFVEADNRAIENQYPTLTAEEIASFTDAAGRSVGDLAADEAVLFLWATNPKLTEALQVIEGWGFRYVTNLVWVKDRIGMGYWARQRHELLLIAKRGEMAPPAESDRPDSVIEAPRGRHSAKPESVYELIEGIWPDGSWVELFSRSPREGWAAFGNQLP